MVGGGRSYLQIREPTVHATIITPSEYVGNLLTLCNECRGVQSEYIFLDDARVMLKYLLPLSEIVTGKCQKPFLACVDRTLPSPLLQLRGLFILSSGDAHTTQPHRFLRRSQVTIVRVRVVGL